MVNMDNIRSMCKDIGISEGRTSDEYLFTLQAVDLFFYHGNIGKIDIKTGFVDGTRDGGIDFIYSDSDTLYLIQGKSSDSLSLEDIKNIYHKIIETVSNFTERKYNDYSDKLVSAYLNAYDNLNDDKNIELVLFTNTQLTESMRTKLYDYFERDEFSSFNLSIYDSEEIEKLTYTNEKIEEDSIKISLTEKNNFLSYGENGLIVNAKASSIKRLYEKYRQNGLFNYNIREHITQKNVDDAIESTIKKEKDLFWFLNNGITIGCDDFDIDGYKIRLYGFSIINGAQTTTKIGESKIINEDNDFDVVCKIVRSDSSLDADKKQQFIFRISEASNSQKPIKPRDLKSNTREQIKLQRDCANNGRYCLAVSIKRGVQPLNNNKVSKEFRVSNEYIGQLIYSCILQNPGSARSKKDSLFSSPIVYKMIYMRKHDYNTLYDLVKLASIYDDYSNMLNNGNHKNDLDWISIVKNGKYVVLATVLYFYKKKFKIISDYEDEKLHKDNIDGLLISNYEEDDREKLLHSLFEQIIRQIKRFYEAKKEQLKITSFSNLFKSDNNYEIILQWIEESFDEEDWEKINNRLKVFSKSEDGV